MRNWREGGECVRRRMQSDFVFMVGRHNLGNDGSEDDGEEESANNFHG
jgi:hypothetical protein